MALPEKKALARDSVTAIKLEQEFAFGVTVANAGCALERKIRVSAALSGGEPPLSGEGQIDELFPLQQATVVIGHLALPALDERLLLRVEIEPVPTETQLDNNSAEYPVEFVVG